MKRNELDDLIKQKTESSGLTDVKINKKLIQQRVYRKRLLVARHPGTASPLKPIEEYIISMLNEMARMRSSSRKKAKNKNLQTLNPVSGQL